MAMSRGTKSDYSMTVCEAKYIMRSAKVSVLGLAILASTLFPVLGISALQDPAGRQGGRGGLKQVAGPRVNALVITGGGFHDYPFQAKVLVDSVSKVLPVDWTVAIQGGRGTTGKQPLLENPAWAKGFDIVVHNQCFADTTDEALI